MRILDRALSRLGLMRKTLRSYDAAAVGRLLASWILSSTTGDAEILKSLRLARDRSRDLARNNDYARRYFKLVVMNMVGPRGVQFQSKVYDEPGKPDNVANQKIEWGWWDWSKKAMAGGGSWRQAQALMAETVARDGEVLVKFIRGRSAGNPHNFAIQFIEADHLDETYSVPDKNISMGIEYDDAGKRVAYWIWERHPGEFPVTARSSNRRIRVPASEMLHLFYRERPSQSRGMPWAHSAMVRLKHLVGFEEATVIAARVSAAQMGIIVSPDGEMKGPEDAQGNVSIEAEPGTFPILPPGYDMRMFDPKQPSGNFEPFIKATLRGIASGVGVSYSSLSSDLGDANYSSLRSGALVERDTWMSLQEWMIDEFCVPVFEAWLDMALTSGTVALPHRKYDKYNQPQFISRRWPWVDPLKDLEAEVVAINNALSSRSKALAERGLDFEDLLDELAYEQKKLDEKKIRLSAAEPKKGKEKQDEKSD